MADKDLDELVRGSKAAADAAGKLERAQKSLQDAVEKTSGAMGRLNAVTRTSFAGLVALEKQIASLAKATSSLEEALSGVNKRLVETTGLSLLGAAAIDSYAKAHKGVEQAAAAAVKTEEAVTKARSSSATAAASQSSELRKLGKSVLDVVSELSKGEDPLKVLIDKGPALWEVFSKARDASGGLRGMLGDIGKAAAPVVDGIGASLAGLAPLLEPLALPLAGVAAAAGVAVGAVAITAQQIGKTVGENLDHLNLTEEQLERVKHKGVTMGDVLAAAWKGVADVLSGVWKTVADAIVGFVGPALKAVGDFFGNLYQGIIDGIMGAVRAAFQVVGGFIGGIRAAFAGLPPAIADLVVSAVNAAAGGLETLANNAIGIVNKLMRMANEVAAKLGLPIRLPELDTVSIGRLENKYAGAAAALGKTIAKGTAQGFADGGKAYDQMVASAIESVAAARNRRVLSEAGPAPKAAKRGGSGAGGDITHNAVNENDSTVINNSTRNYGGQAECACNGAEASVRDLSDVRPVEVVQVELLKAQKLEDEVVKAMPQPEALEPFRDRLGEIVDHFERLASLAPDLGKNFEAAFGGSGKALTGVVSAVAKLGKSLTEIAKEQQGDISEEKAIELTRQRVNASVTGFAEMSIAAKDFFDKNSSGYAALQAVEKAYRAWQFAQSVQQMAQEATATVRSISNSMAKGAASTAAGAAKMFETLGPFAFPAVAAMVALLAGFGLSTAGGGSAPGVNDMKTRQDKQGTGSVLGDPKAKSDSLEKALGYAEKYQNKDLEYGNAMVRSLKSIDDQIGAVASALAKSFAAGGMLSTDGLNLGATGTAASLSTFGFGKTTTRTLQDQGVQFNAASLGDLINGQSLSGSTYQQVLETTKKKAFFLTTSNKSKVVTETGALDADFVDQVTKLVTSLGKGVADAAKALGATDVEGSLARFQVDLGKLSFKDMTGTQIEEALNAVFGKLGDDMAKAAVPAVAEFQKVGEGAFETLVRVARQYEVIDTTLKSVGKEFGEIGTASLAARERLVDLVGGLDNLTEQTAFFGEHFLTDDERLKPVRDAVTEKLADLKLPANLSRDDFKTLVLAQDVSTEAGAKLYAALMELAPAFDKVAAAAEAAKTASDDRRTSIQDQIDELTKSPADLLAKSRDKEREATKKLDEALVPLLETLWKLQDAAKVDEKRNSIQDQIDDLTLTPVAKLAKSRAAEMAAVEALDKALVPLLKNLWDLQDAADAAKLATDRENMRADLLEAQGRTAEATALKRSLALAAITDPVQKQYQQQIWAAQDAAAKVSAARDVLTQAYQREHDAIQATKDKFTELSKSLRAFSAGLADTIADPAARYRSTRGTFLATAALARGGDADAMGRLQAEGEAFTAAAHDYASTSLDYLRDVGLVRSAVDEAADAADRQVSIAERQLEALDASVQGLIAVNASVVSVEQAILNLQGALAEANAAGVASVGGSGLGLGANDNAPNTAAGGTGNAAFSWLLVNSMAGRANSANDPAFRGIYDEAAAYKPGYFDIVATQGIEAANRLVGAGQLKFATGGGFEVGGSGPPDSKFFGLALSPGEAVNVRRRGEGGDHALVNELRRLREELADLRATNARIATSNDKMERTLTNVTEGGRAMQTQAAA